MENKKSSKLVQLLVILAGSFLVAVSTTCFFEPNGLVIGGVTGLAIVVAEISYTSFGISIPLWITNIIINIPLFLLALRSNGKDFLLRTFFATAALSVFLSLTENFPKFAIQGDLLINAIFGAVIMGFGTGLIFRCKTTTGGSDLLASVIHNKIKHISIAKILFVVDTVIMIMGLFVFGVRSSMYAIIAIFIITRTTDVILDGFDFAKAAFIISDKPKEIADLFMKETERGATYIKASGVYTGTDKNMLMIVMNSKEIVAMKEIIKKVDPDAFIIVADVREALGEGFREIS